MALGRGLVHSVCKHTYLLHSKRECIHSYVLALFPHALYSSLFNNNFYSLLPLPSTRQYLLHPSLLNLSLYHHVIPSQEKRKESIAG